jgi:hypothetical protein
MPSSSRVKAVPWLLLLQAGVIVGERWSALSQEDRARLVLLLRESRGRPGNLSAKERAELRSLVNKLELKSAGPELAALLRSVRRWR